jgi:5'-3' exonuclease
MAAIWYVHMQWYKLRYREGPVLHPSQLRVPPGGWGVAAVSMGVPAFFAWLCRKYPQVLTDLPGAAPSPEVDELTAAMMAAFRCDNLYLDMNGIIHPCCHPEGGAPQPKNEAEMFDNVLELLDALVRRLQPQRLLYLAIDGVAPRAKMNQQRARRFRSQAEAKERVQVSQPSVRAGVSGNVRGSARHGWSRPGCSLMMVGSRTPTNSQAEGALRRKLQDQGLPVPEPKPPAWDHNVITPGTCFM